MAFYKKILVLKQVAAGFSTDGKNVSGIARVEADGREATLYLTLLNLASAAEGDYGAYLVNREGAVSRSRRGKIPSAFQSGSRPIPISRAGSPAKSRTAETARSHPSPTMRPRSSPSPLTA